MSIYDKSSLVLIPSGTKTGKVFSQKPVSGDGDFTFTRSSAATRVNADGNIEKETGNLLTYSKNLASSGWTLASATSSAAADFDGGNNANEITGSGFIYQSISGFSGVHTFSVYAKAGNWEGVRLRIDIASNSPQVFFNLSDGSYFSNSNDIDVSITDVGNDWYRCTLTGNVSAANNFRIYPADSTNLGGTGSVILYKAQAEYGLVARDYIETTTSAVYGGITDNVPRLDYTDSSCPALLLEPLRTNNIAHSEYLVGISAVNATTSANETISPDGGNNATKLSALISAPSSQWARYYNIVQTNQKQALSIYAKAGNIDDFTITYYDQSTGDLFFNYDLGAGSVSAPTGNANYVDADIQDLGNGWYRCIAVVNAQAAGTNGQFQVSAGVQRVVQNIGDYVYIYGYQWEQNASYATSYIPTYGSSVSRVQDSFYNNGYQANNIFGTNSGSIFFDFGDEFTLFDGVSNSSPVDRMQFVDITAYGGGYFRFRGGETNHYLQLVNMDAANTSLTFSDQTKYCICWDSNGVDFYGDGALIDSTTIGIVPSINRIENGLSGTQRETRIERILFFTNKLSSQEAIDLTTL
jgi:hypothetical protein